MLVRHACYEVDGSNVWYRATVLDMRKINDWQIFNVLNNWDEEVRQQDAWGVFWHGTLQLESVSAADMIDRVVKHMPIDEQGKEQWQPGLVVAGGTGDILLIVYRFE